MGRHIVTVARQFGCGGGEIAKKLAELLSVEYFDKELLEKAAEASGISKDAFERADERAASSFLYSLAMSSYSVHISPVGVNDVMLSDKLFTVQSDAIRKLAAEKDCVIVGRCADDLLSSYEGLTRIFIHAPLEYRLAVVMERHQLSESSARTLIRKTDKKRASYYNFYTSKDWGTSQNYDITINAAVLGVDKTAALLEDFVLARG